MPNSLLVQILEQEQKKKKTVKQQRIIETAIKLFAEKGYSNTSTAEIAKAAEVSEGTIFKHYGTKEHLLLSVVVPFIKEFLPMIAESVITQTFSKELTFAQFLRAFLINRVEFITENRDIFQVVIKEIFYREELKKELLPYALEKVKPLYYQIIDEYKARGELAARSNEELLKLSLQCIGGFLVTRFILFDHYTVATEEIDSFLAFMMNGLGAGAQ